MTTRGKSPLSPEGYINDSIVQVWLDRRHLANIAVYMEESGRLPNSYAELVRFAVETTNTLLERAGKEQFTKTIDASNYLEARFRASLNPKGKGRKNLTNNLLMDSGYVRGDFSEELARNAIPSSPVISREEIEEMKQHSRKQFGDALALERETKDSEDLNSKHEALSKPPTEE